MEPVYVIAEYGQTMGGDIDTAHRQVDAARQAGAMAFKTQLLTPDLIAAADARPYWSHGPKVTSQRDSFRRSGLIPYTAWAEVAEHAAKADIDFIASPFDLYAVEALAQISGVVFKIASGDLTNVPLLRAVADAATRPVIVSTGAATEREVMRAATELGDTRVVWLACTLAYPTDVRDAQLGRIAALRNLVLQSNWSANARGFGYSDHVGKSWSAVGAVALGATVLEVHTTLNPGRDTDCPDDAMALDPERLAAYITAANTAAVMIGDGHLHPIPAEMPARAGAQRSLHYTRTLPEGHRLNPDDVIALRPGGGMSPLEWDHVIGATLTRRVTAGPIEPRDLR